MQFSHCLKFLIQFILEPAESLVDVFHEVNVGIHFDSSHSTFCLSALFNDFPIDVGPGSTSELSNVGLSF